MHGATENALLTTLLSLLLIAKSIEFEVDVSASCGVRQHLVIQEQRRSSSHATSTALGTSQQSSGLESRLASKFGLTKHCYNCKKANM